MRTDFSFNTLEGACPTCKGLGRTLAVDRAAAVNEALSLEGGTVAFWGHQYREYQIGSVPALRLARPRKRARTGFQHAAKSAAVRRRSIRSDRASASRRKTAKTVGAGRFEGVVPLLMRRLSEQEPDASAARAYFTQALCPDCEGERLCAQSRSVTVASTCLLQLAAVSLRNLAAWGATRRG